MHLLHPLHGLSLIGQDWHRVTVSVMAVNAKVKQHTSQRQTGLLLNLTRTSFAQGSCIEILTANILLKKFDMVDSPPRWQIKMKNMSFQTTLEIYSPRSSKFLKASLLMINFAFHLPFWKRVYCNHLSRLKYTC